jgi:hypothetical protein
MEITIVKGEMPSKDREEAKLSNVAVGGVWWLSSERLVHGWFYLHDDAFSTLWDQIKDGKYACCSFTFGLTPLEHGSGDLFAWSGNPLSIESVGISFRARED